MNSCNVACRTKQNILTKKRRSTSVQLSVLGDKANKKEMSHVQYAGPSEIKCTAANFIEN
jgi:hypothetical protein